MGYTCNNEHPEPEAATTMITNFETGDVVTLCAPCSVTWMATLLEALDFTVRPPWAAEDGAQAPGEGEPAPDPDRPKRRRGGGRGAPGDGVGDQVPEDPAPQVGIAPIPAELTAPSSPFPDPTADHG